MTNAQTTDDRAQQQTEFLLHLRGTGLVSLAASAVSVTRRTLYLWREADPQFAARWDDALAEARQRISAALRRSADDQASAAALLEQVADRLKDPGLSTEDRSTHMEHLRALGERIDELKALATSEAAMAHKRFVAERREQLRKDWEAVEITASELDEAIKAVEPALKRFRFALADAERTARQAEAAFPGIAFETAWSSAWYFHAPTVADLLKLPRPMRRHQQALVSTAMHRRPEGAG